MNKSYSYCHADRLTPGTIDYDGRRWRSGVEANQNACRTSQSAYPGAYWLLSKHEGKAPKVYAYVESNGVVEFLRIPRYPHLLTEEVIVGEWSYLRAPLTVLMDRFKAADTPAPTDLDAATMATQLRSWADLLADDCPTHTVIDAMRKRADKLAPRVTFDRRVKFTRTWADDGKLVAARLDDETGPLQAWADQVRDEIEEALPGCKLAWEDYYLETDGGTEGFTATARLRFEYDPNDVDFNDFSDEAFDDCVLQSLLYDQGGCAGGFAFVKED